MHRVDELTTELIERGLSAAGEAELDALLADDQARRRHEELLAVEGWLRAQGEPPLVREAALDAIHASLAVDVERRVMRIIGATSQPAWKQQPDELRCEKVELARSDDQRRKRPKSSMWLWTTGPLAAALLALVAIVNLEWFRDVDLAASSPVVVGSSPAALEVIDGQQQVSQAFVGRAVRPGEVLRATQTATSVELRYPDGTRVWLSGAAELQVQRDRAGGKRLTLRYGALRADVARQRPNQPLVIATPHAAVRVLGTRFDLVASAEEGTRLDLESGRVSLERGAELPRAITAGTVAIVPADASPVVVKSRPRVLSQPTREMQVANLSHANFARDGRTILGAARRHLVYWSDDDRQELVPLGGQAKSMQVRQMAGSLVAVQDNRQNVNVWDADRRAPVAKLSQAGGDVIALSPDGAWVALKIAGDKEVSTQIHRFASGERLVIDAFNKGLCATASPDGRLLAVGRNGLVLIDAASGDQMAQLMIVDDRPADKNRSGAVVSAAFSADGQLVAGGSMGAVEVWRVADHQRIATLSQPGLWMYQVAISPDRRRVAGANGDRVWIWDLSSGAELAMISAAGGVSHLAFSPDSRALLTVVGRRDVSVWNLTELEAPATPTAPPTTL